MKQEWLQYVKGEINNSILMHICLDCGCRKYFLLPENAVENILRYLRGQFQKEPKVVRKSLKLSE